MNLIDKAWEDVGWSQNIGMSPGKQEGKGVPGRRHKVY